MVFLRQLVTIKFLKITIKVHMSNGSLSDPRLIVLGSPRGVDGEPGFSAGVFVYIYIYTHKLNSILPAASSRRGPLVWKSPPGASRVSATKHIFLDLRRGWLQRRRFQKTCYCKLCLCYNSAVCQVVLSEI